MLIAANWKMHGDRTFLAAYFEGAAALSWPTAQTHLVFPPATLLERAAEAAARAGLVPGAQAIHGALDGAHTGCLSAEQVAEAGARWALLGHSERRALGETDLDVAAQLEAAARAGLRGLVCVGEGLEVREGGEAEAHVLAQLAAVLSAWVRRLVMAPSSVFRATSPSTMSALSASCCPSSERLDRLEKSISASRLSGSSFEGV